mmetsp:Transcript_10883/g.45692  ORF Transcript_10883/g.45692 Transcript_10883/m.45692 type:complete len:240 (-) Transcript_10883:37-756(-)
MGVRFVDVRGPLRVVERASGFHAHVHGAFRGDGAGIRGGRDAGDAPHLPFPSRGRVLPVRQRGAGGWKGGGIRVLVVRGGGRAGRGVGDDKTRVLSGGVLIKVKMCSLLVKQRLFLSGLTTRDQQSDVVAVEQDLVEFRDHLAPLGGHLIFDHIIEHHVDVHVKPPERSHHLLVRFHYDPDARPHAPIHELGGKQLAGVRGHSLRREGRHVRLASRERVRARGVKCECRVGVDERRVRV